MEEAIDKGGHRERDRERERAVKCEVIHEIHTLIPPDLFDTLTCSLHIQKVYSAQGQGSVGGACNRKNPLQTSQ